MEERVLLHSGGEEPEERSLIADGAVRQKPEVEPAPGGGAAVAEPPIASSGTSGIL